MKTNTQPQTAVQELLAQRDELLAALKSAWLVAEWYARTSDNGQTKAHANKLKAAITKAEQH